MKTYRVALEVKGATTHENPSAYIYAFTEAIDYEDALKHAEDMRLGAEKLLKRKFYVSSVKEQGFFKHT